MGQILARAGRHRSCVGVEPDVQRHRQADDLGRGLEVAEGVRSGHRRRLRRPRSWLKRSYSDKTRRSALALFEHPQADDGVERIVRINSMRERVGIEDVHAILATKTPPPALMMPKIRTPDEVVILDQLLTEAGHSTRLHVIIETNEGLEAAFEVAKCSPRIDALFFGGVDMAAELRCVNSYDGLFHARARVVHASAAAGLDVIDVPFLDLNDLDGMRIEAERVRDMGFTGKGSVHPKQIEVLNRVFMPSDDQIARARRIIKEFEAADTGLVVIDGKLIEKPVLREMYRIVAVAERMDA